MPALDGVLETALYVDDLPRARRFYEDVLGLKPVFADPLLGAFATAREALTAWEETLAAHAVVIEGRTDWPRGGTSIYFRDPDGHLLELATPGLWPGY